MKHLFTDEHETYTDDVAFVLDGAVSVVVAGAIVKRNMEKRKEAREALKGAR